MDSLPFSIEDMHCQQRRRQRQIGRRREAVWGYITLYVLILTGLTFFWTSTPAHAAETDGELERAEVESTVARYFKDLDDQLALAVDPLMKTIACRLGYGGWTIRSLARATHEDHGKVFIAVGKLAKRGLVRADNLQWGDATIYAKDEVTAAKLRSWARHWCSSDDACGVGR